MARKDMLPILRRSTSLVLVGLLCALVLSWTTAPVFAEDTISSIVKVEPGVVGTIAIAGAIDAVEAAAALATPLRHPGVAGVPNCSILAYSVLRL